ncbi:hypothetical protein PanNE5_30010 [Pandoraea sp. NE5]|nr:hypothetical protein PanNE5_30010 [Pandoraea sp. NE5]
MAIFVVIPTRSDHKLQPVLAEHFPEQHYKLPQGEYLIQFSGTTQELSEKLGITGGENGTAVVAAISSYYGRAPADIWEWLKSRWS